MDAVVSRNRPLAEDTEYTNAILKATQIINMNTVFLRFSYIYYQHLFLIYVHSCPSYQFIDVIISTHSIPQPRNPNAQKPKPYITLFLFSYRKTPESLDLLSIDEQLQSLMGFSAGTHWISKVRIIF